MRYYIILVTFVILIVQSAYGQKFTVSGYIKDAQTGESLIGATIFRVKSSSGSTANTHGFYSLTFPKDSISLL
ncbi:MAG TPA: hypothetical protein VIT44_15375, partial [Cyclobacteriaceae bacterium]